MKPDEKWKDLQLIRKTSKSYELTFKKDGVPQNITDWTIYFTVKLNMQDSDDSAKIKKDVTTHVDVLNGKTLIELCSSDTDIPARSYYYDIKYKDANDNVGVILRGRYKVVEIVTQRT